MDSRIINSATINIIMFAVIDSERESINAIIINAFCMEI